MKIYVIQNKNGTKINNYVNVKSWLTGEFVKKGYIWFLTCRIASMIKRVKMVSI